MSILALMMAFMLVFQTPPAPQPITPAVPFVQTPRAEPLIPPDDARTNVCDASRRSGFLPYITRTGDSLRALLDGSTAITPVQAAALNCLDTVDDLPAGVVIFLPADVNLFGAGDISSPPGDSPARIIRLEINPATIANDSRARITWEAEGVQAYLYPCPLDSTAPCARPIMLPPVVLSGERTVGPFGAAGARIYQLEIIGADGGRITRQAALEITCAQESLGGARPDCPEQPPRAGFGVWQPFERGAMIYLAETDEIIVLAADGRAHVYADQYVEGQPDPDDVPPDGLYTPVRGFGLLWRALGGASSDLGWATAPEQGYDITVQPAGRLSFTTYLTTPDGVIALTRFSGEAAGFWALVN